MQSFVCHKGKWSLYKYNYDIVNKRNRKRRNRNCNERKSMKLWCHVVDLIEMMAMAILHFWFFSIITQVVLYLTVCVRVSEFSFLFCWFFCVSRDFIVKNAGEIISLAHNVQVHGDDNEQQKKTVYRIRLKTILIVWDGKTRNHSHMYFTVPVGTKQWN